MSKKNIDRSVESRVCFEQLEEWVREQIQFYVQELLEDEVTQLLGRRKNERRREVDAPGGYRDAHAVARANRDGGQAIEEAVENPHRTFPKPLAGSGLGDGVGCLQQVAPASTKGLAGRRGGIGLGM